MALDGEPRAPAAPEPARITYLRRRLASEGLALQREPGAFVVVKPNGDPLFSTSSESTLLAWLSRQ